MSIVVSQRCTAELAFLRAAGRWGLRWKHSSSKRPRRGEQEGDNTVSKGTADGNEKRSRIGHNVRTTDTSDETATVERINGNASLPLPPFLRKPKLRSLTPFDRHKSSSGRKVDGTYIEGNKHKLRIKLQRAPLATRMQENPYAHMLADTIREDRFTGQRLPRASLLRFSVVEDEETGEGTAGDLHLTQDTAVEARQEGQLTLLPLSLFGEAIPKKKNAGKLSPEDSQAAEALRDAAAGLDSASSYVLARHDVLSWISANGRQGIERLIGSGMRQSLDKSGRLRGVRAKSSPLFWQQEMPKMVLQSMRKVVRRQLRYLMSDKSSADRPGIMMQVPSVEGQQGSLAMLDRVDNVMCVLRLRQSTTTDKSLEERHRLELEPESEQPMWMQDEQKRLLWGQLSQPVREVDVEARYPTMRYRNRRVPLYSLEQLLGGSKAVMKLVAGTSFAESEWVTLSSSKSTQPLLQWLFRLHSYLAYEAEPCSDR